MLKHIRKCLVSGLFILIPIWVSLIVIRAVYRVMVSALLPILEYLFPKASDAVLAIISIILFLILLYFIGCMTRFVIGQHILMMAERLFLHIPVVKTVYLAVKQIVASITSTTHPSFKSVVLVQFPNSEMRALGFVTGNYITRDGREYWNVFIPTSPNPTSGYLEFVPKECVEATTLSVEDGIKMVISAGALVPENNIELNKANKS